MTFRRWMIVLLAACDLGLLAALVQANRLSRTVARRLNDTLQENAALTAVNAKARGGIEMLTAQLEERRRKTRAASVQLQAASRAEELHQRSADNSEQMVALRKKWRAIGNDPELRKLYLQEFRANVDRSWGRLFAQLNLSDDQISRFQDILAEFEDKTLDLYAIAGDSAMSVWDPAIQAQRVKDGNQAVAELHQLLGPDGYKIYSAYDHAVVVGPVVDAVAAASFSTDAPLTASQAQSLTQILADNSQRGNGGWVHPNTINWPAVLAQAELILTSAQMAALGSAQQALGPQTGQLYGGPAGGSTETVATVSEPPPIPITVPP